MRVVGQVRGSETAGRFVWTGVVSALGSSAFACTPERFPGLMACAQARKDLHQFAPQRRIPVASRAGTEGL